LGQVVSQTELILHRGDWKRNGQGVVCASGSFDLLHPGHIRLLEQARALGDVLVVAIEGDSGAPAEAPQRGQQAISGHAPDRPSTPASERAEILAALAAVDYVTQIEDSSAHAFLLSFLPDIYVKGGAPSSDESGFREADELEALGCKVVRIPLEPGYSTARLIQRIDELSA
jgi:rfaE bifunctional protein nucleotidyltransferase chain/domain